jgi:hypothetical protein
VSDRQLLERNESQALIALEGLEDRYLRRFFHNLFRENQEILQLWR